MAKRRKFKKRGRLSIISFKSKPVYSKYEAAYKFFAVFAICSLISSAVYAVLSRATPGIFSILISIIFGAGGVGLGYGISAIWGLFTACPRVRSDYSYERTESYFSIGTLVPAVITALLPAIIAGTVARRLTATVTSSGEVIYDNASAVPALVATSLLACLIIGIVLWFIPYNKIITLGNVIPFGIGFIIVALAGAIFFGASTVFLSFAFIFYLFSSMAVLNQGYLIKIINDSGTGTATAEVRKYNLTAVLIAFGAIAVAGFFATALIVGIVVSARIAFYSLFKTAFNNGGGGGGGAVGSTPSFNASEKIFGGISGLDGEGDAKLYYIVFLTMIVGFFVALLILRKRKKKRFPKPSELINRLFNLILALISWFGSLFSAVGSSENDISLDDYSDEELIMDKKSSTELLNLQGKRGAKRFSRMMSECATEGERLSLCYKASRAGYIRNQSILKEGDTPSEALKKLEGFTAPQDYNRFARITDAFILYAYAGAEPSTDISDDITAEAARIIAELSGS